MKKENTFRPTNRALVALALLSSALIGCAGVPTTPEQIVHQRSQDYWQARLAGKLDTAYALTTPSYRKLRTAEQFRKQHGSAAAVQEVTVTGVQCEAARCTARVQLKVKAPIPGMERTPVSTYTNEVWLLEDGQWWLHQSL